MTSGNNSEQQMVDLQRRNTELNALIERFIADSDRVFASKTWQIGYAVANLVRRVQRWFGASLPQRHIDASHFRQLAENCHAYGFRAAVVVVEPEDGIPEIPASYVVGDVETAIRDVWDRAGREISKHVS